MDFRRKSQFTGTTQHSLIQQKGGNMDFPGSSHRHHHHQVDVDEATIPDDGLSVSSPTTEEQRPFSSSFSATTTTRTDAPLVTLLATPHSSCPPSVTTNTTPTTTGLSLHRIPLPTFVSVSSTSTSRRRVTTDRMAREYKKTSCSLHSSNEHTICMSTNTLLFYS